VDNLIGSMPAVWFSNYVLTSYLDASAGNMLLPAWCSSPITGVELPSAKRIVQTLGGAMCAPEPARLGPARS
jgi:hypothetical protein